MTCLRNDFETTDCCAEYSSWYIGLWQVGTHLISVSLTMQCMLILHSWFVHGQKLYFNWNNQFHRGTYLHTHTQSPLAQMISSLKSQCKSTRLTQCMTNMAGSSQAHNQQLVNPSAYESSPRTVESRRASCTGEFLTNKPSMLGADSTTKGEHALQPHSSKTLYTHDPYAYFPTSIVQTQRITHNKTNMLSPSLVLKFEQTTISKLESRSLRESEPDLTTRRKYITQTVHRD